MTTIDELARQASAGGHIAPAAYYDAWRDTFAALVARKCAQMCVDRAPKDGVTDAAPFLQLAIGMEAAFTPPEVPQE